MFEKFWLRRLNPFNASYNDDLKIDVCRYYMGKKTLGDLHKHVIITSFRLDGGPELHGRNIEFKSTLSN